MMRKRLLFPVLVVLTALTLSACADDESNGDGDPAATTTTTVEGASGSASDSTEVPITPTPELTGTPATPEGTQAPTEIPLADGPPPLEVDGTLLGLGNYCWTLDGEEVCDEHDGVVTSAAVLDVTSGDSINVTGFGQLDPVEASGQLWTRPESGESQGANRTIWERTGDPIEVPVTPGTDAIAVTIDAEPGSYLLDLTVTYEEGPVEYGLQVDVQ